MNMKLVQIFYLFYAFLCMAKVSRGAECIMLNKEFFAKHANEKVKKLIRHQVRPYPDEDTFQNNLQIKEDWELYKRNLIVDLTSH